VRAGPSEAQLQRARGQIVAGLLAHIIAAQEPETFVEVLLVEAARTARNELIAGALGNLFDDAPSGLIRAATNVLTLAADGRLTLANWGSAQAQETILRRLSAHSRDPDQAAAAAQFICSVISTYQRR
jgi:hypothetical protein